jgi:hypothetical protein
VAYQDTTPDGAGLCAVRVGADGVPLGSAFSLVKPGGGAPRPEVTAAIGGDVVAWMNGTTANLGLVDGHSVRNPLALTEASSPALAPAPGGLAATWTAAGEVLFARTAPPFDSLSAPVIVDATKTANAPRVVAMGNAFGIVWEDSRRGEGNEDIEFVTVDPDGKHTSAHAIAGDLGSANCPDIAWTGTHAAVAYYQFRDGPPAVYLTLVTPHGDHGLVDLQVSEHGAARYPHVAAGDGVLAVAYAQRKGPVRVGFVSCR